MRHFARVRAHHDGDRIAGHGNCIRHHDVQGRPAPELD
jgi:hypothetical protein